MITSGESPYSSNNSSDSHYETPLRNNLLLSESDEVVEHPHIRDRIEVVDPDTHQLTKFLVVGRAGKKSGKYAGFYNVQNIETNAMKSLDFNIVTDWRKIKEEVLYTAINSTEILDAKKCELEKWVEYGVYTEVNDVGQSAITTRWVLTEKPSSSTGNIIKARLVARGFEEKATDVRTDSPTISKENLRLVSAIAVMNKWQVHSIDVKSAFLQGFPIERTIHILPPPEADTSKLWKLNKTVYGLCDASRSWYLKISAELNSKNAVKSKYDNALFFWRVDGKLEGLIGCHVDDFYFCGSQLFHTTIIDHIRDKFNISQECLSSMLYTGIEITQTENAIFMHQNKYIEDIQQLSFGNMESKRKLNKKETRLFKGLVGQLQWTAKQTRPDIAFSGCELSTRVRDATMEDVNRANKQVRKMKSFLPVLCIPDIGNVKGATLIVYADSSHANLVNGGSQGGFIVFLKGENGKSVPLIWTSHKLKRVVKSAKAAETMALQDASECAILIKTIILEIFDFDESLIPITCFCDNKSVVDAIHSTTTNDDKRSYIDICTLRDLLEKEEINDFIWIESQENPADCLTKATASSELTMQLVQGSSQLPGL